MDRFTRAEQIGRVAAIWRYPVKSMRGEFLLEAAFDAWGLVGDRRFAFASTAAPQGKPLLASRERTAMLGYTPRLSPTPTVTTPYGLCLPLPSRELTAELGAQVANPAAQLTFQASAARPFTDVRPVALISSNTLRGLSEALGHAIDPQRFRSNLILDLDDSSPFAEDALAGATLHFGPDPGGQLGGELRVLERIPRCRMISLDPETTAADPTLLRHLARFHDGCAGIYASVRRPGPVSAGDAVWRLS